MTLFIFIVGCPEPIVYQQDSIQPPDIKHMVKIVDDNHRQGGFWIDAFEYPNIPNQRPLANASFDQAKQACAESGKRLCTAQEWRRACTGSDKQRFGYGDTYERERCHTASSLDSGHTSMMLAQEFLVDSGSKQYCQTDGVFDLIGNLEEWVLDDWQGRVGSLEGGAWYTFRTYADCSGNYSRQPDYRTPMNRPVYSAGFRCCWTPESPTTSDIRADALDRLQNDSDDASYNPDLEYPIGDSLWMDVFEYPNQPNQRPKTNVSWEEANTSCTNVGKRLCTTTEWELGCGGHLGWTFPYGDTFIDDLCDIGHAEGSLSGTHLGCQSSFGMQDMVGSVWEWTATTIDANVLRTNPSDILKELRGGSWFVDASKGSCRPSDGYPLAKASARYPDVGFRCCRGAITTTKTKPVRSIVCPTDMIAQQDFCIDQYEYPNLPGVHPIADATLSMAVQACNDSGKHLCTDQEWISSCEGEEGHRWPYGSEYKGRACNDHGWVDTEIMGNASKSGTFTDCQTNDGVFDMSGNLWEWTSGPTPRLRGGGWQLSAGLGQCRSFSEPDSSYHAGEVGFRCCATGIEAQGLLND